MQFDEVVRARHMIRTYDPQRPVPRETVDQLLELAVRAPSAGHSQGWRFLVLDDITSRERFWSATTDGDQTDESAWLRRLRTAPVLVVVFSSAAVYLDRYAEADKGHQPRDESLWPIPYWHVDAGMAAMLLLLGATDRGLGACFFGVPGEHWDDLRAAFDVDEQWAPVGVVSLGHPAPDRRSPSLRRGRRPLDEVVRYGSFGSAG
jgi:nitroreductase